MYIRVEGREEDVGAFGVRAFPTSHDVPCVGYRIHTPDGKTMSIATDLGTLTPPVHEALTGFRRSVPPPLGPPKRKSGVPPRTLGKN